MYCVAKIERKWVLTRNSDVALLVGTNEYAMAEIASLCNLRRNQRNVDTDALASRFGKLKVGRRFWLTQKIVGTDTYKGVAFGDEEAVDEALTRMGRIEVTA